MQPETATAEDRKAMTAQSAIRTREERISKEFFRIRVLPTLLVFTIA